MGLLDIAPPEIVTKRFEIRGGTIDIMPIRARDWAAILQRFPQIKPGDETTMLSSIDGLVPAIIAAGLGACGDAETESLIVERLNDAEQVAIFGEIMRLTAPSDDAAPLLVSPVKESGPRPNGSAKMQTKNSQQPSLL